MRKIRLSNGDEFEIRRCGADGEQLRLTLITARSVLDTIMLFGYPENTHRIEHYFEGTETDRHVYEGYTALTAVSAEGNDISVVLRKP